MAIPVETASEETITDQAIETVDLNYLPDWIDLPDAATPALEAMNHVVSQVLPGHLSIKFTKLTQKEMWGEMPYRRQTANAFGIMHGGTIFSLGDTITGCYLWAKGELAVTASSEIKYIRPIKEGIITCRAKEVSREGKRIKLVADYYNEDKKRVARLKIDYVLVEGV